MGSLSEIRVRNSKPRDRAYKLFDERGLYLMVMPSGGRLWRLKYRMYGREKLISLGAYPDVALSRARERRDEARKLIVEGIDPSAERQERKTALRDTFEGVAEEWLTLQSKSLAPETISILGARLHSALYPYLGSRPISAPLLFVRPGELRQAEWSEFDLEGAEWRIPAARMKMGELHVVPLARQSISLLEDVQPFARGGHYVFPSLRSRDRPMLNNTLNGALRRLGYSTEEQTGHGFRTMASTLLNEQGYPPDVIELQLAHAERNKVRAAYNKAQRLPERRKMMQAWADYLDGLRVGATVIPIGRRLP
jgi:integrase